MIEVMIACLRRVIAVTSMMRLKSSSAHSRAIRERAFGLG